MSFDEPAKRDIFAGELQENPATSTRKTGLVSRVMSALRAFTKADGDTARDERLSEAGSIALAALEGRIDAATPDGARKRQQLSNSLEERTRHNEVEQARWERAIAHSSDSARRVSEMSAQNLKLAEEELEASWRELRVYAVTPKERLLPDGRPALGLGHGVVEGLRQSPKPELDVVVTNYDKALEIAIEAKSLNAFGTPEPPAPTSEVAETPPPSNQPPIFLTGQPAEVRAEAFPGHILMGEPPGISDEDDEEPDDEPPPPYNYMS